MNTLVAASVALIAGAACVFADVQRDSKPPAPYNDKVVLPGNVPSSMDSVKGDWQYSYLLKDALLESGKTDLIVSTVLMLDEAGSYELHYTARWNLPTANIPLPKIPSPILIPIPSSIPTSSGGLDGLNVTETGRYVLSGQVLILEPAETRQASVDNNKVVNQRAIANEKHVLILRLDQTKLAVAGRCASYQVDPVCKKTQPIWYTMKAELGKRTFGIEPR